MMTVFMVMTFSGGMPVLYIVGLLSIISAYVVDKILLLKYYRLTNGFTKHLTTSIVKKFPIAVVMHILFSLFMFSYPNLLNSQLFSKWYGISDSQYFNYPRVSQLHNVIFLIGAVVALTIIWFEPQMRFLFQHGLIKA